MAFKEVPPKEATRPQTEKVIKEWRAKRAERLAADHVAAELKKDEVAMKSWLVAVFREQRFEGMVIGGRITGVSPKDIHVIEDREAFINYIYETDAIDLLQFRVSETAIVEREILGITVPGTRKEEVYDLFDRKA
jgi:hypothetical protein